MAENVALDHDFGGLSSPIPLSYLDDNFGNLTDSLASFNTFSNYLVDTGSANTYAVTLGVGLSATLTNGLMAQIKIANANTGASTLNFNGTGATAITRIDGTALSGGELPAGGIVQFIYSTSATAWILMTQMPAKGLWTPVLGGSATYTLQRGQWTLNGNYCAFTGHLVVNAIGSGSTSVISGLPFTSIDDDNLGCVTVGFFTSLAVNAINLVGTVNQNASTIQFRGSAAAATALSTLAIFGNGASIYFSGGYFTGT